jgi:p38 MAP kinase
MFSSAYDNELETDVVIKKIARPFSSDKAAKRVYREIKLLKHINHYNIISLYNIYGNSENLESFNDV